MGYGEYGGNGSIQVSNWLSNPEAADCKLTKGKGAWDHANNKKPSRLSARAGKLKDDVEAGDQTFVGKDMTVGDDLGTFLVTVSFENAGELAAALSQLQTALNNGRRSASFTVKVLADTPGQIQIAWGEHAPPLTAV